MRNRLGSCYGVYLLGIKALLFYPRRQRASFEEGEFGGGLRAFLCAFQSPCWGRGGAGQRARKLPVLKRRFLQDRFRGVLSLLFSRALFSISHFGFFLWALSICGLYAQEISYRAFDLKAPFSTSSGGLSVFQETYERQFLSSKLLRRPNPPLIVAFSAPKGVGITMLSDLISRHFNGMVISTHCAKTLLNQAAAVRLSEPFSEALLGSRLDEYLRYVLDRLQNQPNRLWIFDMIADDHTFALKKLAQDTGSTFFLVRLDIDYRSALCRAEKKGEMHSRLFSKSWQSYIDNRYEDFTHHMNVSGVLDQQELELLFDRLRTLSPKLGT